MELDTIYLEIEKLRLQGKLEDAFNMCTLERCEESEKIRVVKEKILNQIKNNEMVQYIHQIKTCISENKLEEALEICNQDVVADNVDIILQKVKILMLMGKYEEALNECTEERCHLNHTFNIYKAKLQNKLKNSISQPKYSIVSNFLTRIYANDIKVEEFSQLQDYSWEQLILLIAYYEKNNVKLGIQLIKERLPQYENDIPKKKVLNQLKIRLSSKKLKMHYITIYSNILCTQIDTDLALEIMQKQQDQETPVVMKSEPAPCLPISKPMTKEKSKKSSHMIAVTGVKNNRYTQSSTSHSSIKLSNTSVQDVHIKDVFQEEFLEIERYLYCAMQQMKTQRKAIQAWDILEQIGENSIYNKRAFHQMVNLLYRLCGTNEVPSPISISIDSEKVKTLQQKYE